MVDFNNESTISTPAVDIMRVIILQRRNDLIDSIEHYKKKRKEGVEVSTSIVSSRLSALYLEIEHTLERHLDKEQLKEIHKAEDSTDIVELINATKLINMVLDKIRLTKIDTGKNIDTTRVELENESKGL